MFNLSPADLQGREVGELLVMLLEKLRRIFQGTHFFAFLLMGVKVIPRSFHIIIVDTSVAVMSLLQLAMVKISFKCLRSSRLNLHKIILDL